ncbi:MAG: type II secretion system F family protein [Bacilli bacterium]|nr:type II secretion system F family protein [Bacilli bacterium]
MKSADPLLVIQFGIILALLCLLFYIVRFNISFRLSKRIGKYSIEPLNNDQYSLFDGFFIIYKRLINDLSNSLIKINIIKRYSKRYEKYIDYLDEGKPIDFVSNKILIIVLLMLGNILVNIIQLTYPSVIQLILVMVVGFFLPDIYTSYKTHQRRKRIEADLLNAIIMLNSAFKSGRSTMQAIEIVKNELNGPIKKEFEKMHTEISYGLSLDTVFKRFADRVNIPEISYITSSLIVLNKTGGNIIKVFSSIERSLFSKHKLESELKALTASSLVMSKILLVLPFVFVSIIVLINPTYFNSLFDTFIGLTALFIIIMFYALYAFFVQRVMRVRL